MIYRHMGAELLQLARVVTRDAAVRGPGARLAGTGRQEVPGCGGVRDGDGDALALLAQLSCVVQRSASRHLHGDLPGVGAWLLSK